MARPGDAPTPAMARPLDSGPQARASVREAVGGRGVVEHVSECGQDAQVLVALRRDTDDDAHDLPGVPFHALGELYDTDAGAMDEFAVLAHAVRDGDAVAEIGVRLLFAA